MANGTQRKLSRKPKQNQALKKDFLKKEAHGTIDNFFSVPVSYLKDSPSDP
jgi:hypothetical protein